MVNVIGKGGLRLMPTNRHGKVRRMLKAGKAKVVDRNPFTIMLLYDTACFVQHSSVGIDIGDTIGYAVASDGNIIDKGEISLRTDVSSFLKTKKTYRFSRRNRKTRYRKARFQNRGNKKEGWLPPSIENKIRHTVSWIDRITKYLPAFHLAVETVKFDIQKIENPNIQGKEYQQGFLYGYENVKQYLLFKQQGICHICGKKGDNSGWHIHHIVPKGKGGTDKVSNFALLHKECHIKLHKQGLKLKKDKPVNLIGLAHFNSMRNKLRSILKDRYGDGISFTYGYITKIDRVNLGLEKTHYNDAIAIAGIVEIKNDNIPVTVIKQVRKKKRSLHEATARKWTNGNTGSVRNNKNVKGIVINGRRYSLWDKVRIENKTGYISGFTGTSCYVKDINGEYITACGKSYKQIPASNIKHIGRNNNWITERKAA